VQVSNIVQSLAIEGGAGETLLDMARDLHIASRRLIAKLLEMVDALQDGSLADASRLADIAIALSRHGLEIQRGQRPSAERLDEIAKLLPGADASNVAKVPSRAEPAKTDSILKQFDAIIGATKGKVH
jgi:hypothetical protein